MKNIFPATRFILQYSVVLFLAACAAPSPPPASTSSTPTATDVTGPTASQSRFDSADEAIKALLAASKAEDKSALHDIFGAQVDDLLSGDATQDSIERGNFAKAVALYCHPVQTADGIIVLNIGANNWPFPIPLVRTDGGKWYFDTAAGKDEILNRRIGQDELTAIGVCREYVVAQQEYASKDYNNSGLWKYAQRLNSTPGNKDGLYWESAADDDLSPFGPLVANAQAEGYEDNAVGRREPFHGYLFKVLKTQGPDAPGGQYNYVINGNMVAGFALAAYPAHWGESGVMTFIVNSAGRVYETNLGPDSATLGAALTEFNPDSKWKQVLDPATIP